jgi:hypothetical protein
MAATALAVLPGLVDEGKKTMRSVSLVVCIILVLVGLIVAATSSIYTGFVVSMTGGVGILLLQYVFPDRGGSSTPGLASLLGMLSKGGREEFIEDRLISVYRALMIPDDTKIEDLHLLKSKIKNNYNNLRADRQKEVFDKINILDRESKAKLMSCIDATTFDYNAHDRLLKSLNLAPVRGKNEEPYVISIKSNMNAIKSKDISKLDFNGIHHSVKNLFHN